MSTKKPILIFIEDGSYTYDNRMQREVGALLEAGYDITVICRRFHGDPFYQKISEQLRLYYFPNLTASSFMGHVVEHVISLFFGFFLSFWAYLRHRFIIFHACNPMDILWVLALPYKLFGVKYLFDQHDLCPEVYLSKKGKPNQFVLSILQWLEKMNYWLADAVIVTNESYKEIALSRGKMPSEAVFVVRNSPDLEKFKRQKINTESHPNSEIKIGYLGNMNYQDGVHHLLNAAERVIKNKKDVSFVFIGGGSEQPRLKQLANEKKLNDHVTFTGRIPDPDMLEALSSCHVCVQPDPKNPLNDKSTMNKALEYMALGKPVVSFDLKETRVACGDAALYVSPNDESELAETILRLCEEPTLREKMSQAGRLRVENGFSWQDTKPELLASYHFLVS